MTRAARAAYYGIPCLVALIVYWHGLTSWFLNDDFAWLGLPLELQKPHGLWVALFRPQAQGTVRVISERLFFLIFSSVFGIHALPFRIWVFLTQFANLVLVSHITQRLTGSRLAGFVAPLLWMLNANLSVVMSWTAAYNQILCGFVLLLSFDLLLRYFETGRRVYYVAQLVVFLLGFGVLELNALYPALAALYTLCCARKHFFKTLPLFLPSIVYAVIDLAVIPKSTAPVYHMTFRSGLFDTFSRYLSWALGPNRLGELLDESLGLVGLIGTALIGVVLLAFVVKRLWNRQWLAVFCVGWFLLFLAPVLPLQNHVADYYLTLPLIGLAILAAWAIDTAWHSGVAWKAVAVVLALFYAAGSIAESQIATNWYQERSSKIRELLTAVEAAHQRHPESMIVLSGVTGDLFQSGFQDNPFRLYGVPRLALAPGSESGIQAREELGGMKRFVVSLGELVRELAANRAVVLSISDAGIQNVTTRYKSIVTSQYLSGNRHRVDAGDPVFAARLGPTWNQIENGFRWMPKTATVQLAGPDSEGQRLYVTGYAPAVVVKDGPVTLTFRADGKPLGTAIVKTPDQRFAFDFALPKELVHKYAVEVSVEASRVLKLPGDPRELAMIFGTFEIK